MAIYPEVQRIAFEEIEYVEKFDPNHALPYLEAVIKETLRMFPSIPSFSRKTMDVSKIGKLFIAQDSVLNYPKYNRNRKVYSPRWYHR